MTETTEDFACSDWAERALKIHAIICRIASAGSVRIKFANSSAISSALLDLNRCGVRKPFFANKKRWLYQQVLTNKETYMLLSPNIRLEFIANGSIAYWNGYGDRLDYKKMNEAAEIAGRWIIEKQSPIWICINFGLEYQPFVNLLENLTNEGLSEE